MRIAKAFSIGTAAVLVTFGGWLAIIFVGAAVGDYRVPVSPFPGVSIRSLSDGHVFASGTWFPNRRTDVLASTTEVACSRVESVCESVTANVIKGDSSSYIAIEHETYAVFEWSATKISYGNEFPCGTESYVLFVTEDKGYGRIAKHPTRPGCDGFPADFSVALSDGWEKAERARYEAMPAITKAALRLIGNNGPK